MAVGIKIPGLKNLIAAGGTAYLLQKGGSLGETLESYMSQVKGDTLAAPVPTRFGVPEFGIEMLAYLDAGTAIRGNSVLLSYGTVPVAAAHQTGFRITQRFQSYNSTNKQSVLTTPVLTRLDALEFELSGVTSAGDGGLDALVEQFQNRETPPGSDVRLPIAELAFSIAMAAAGDLLYSGYITGVSHDNPEDNDSPYTIRGRGTTNLTVDGTASGMEDIYAAFTAGAELAFTEAFGSGLGALGVDLGEIAWDGYLTEFSLQGQQDQDAALSLRGMGTSLAEWTIT